MKRNLLLGFTMMGILGSASAVAKPIDISRILRDQTTTVALDLNPKTVFCTDLGYSNVVLKVSVPDLEWLAYFDHRTKNEGLPCMTAGRCAGPLSPNSKLNPDVVLSKGPMTKADIRVVLTEHFRIDAEKQTCESFFSEEVSGDITGIPFEHYRDGNARDLDYKHCAALIE